MWGNWWGLFAGSVERKGADDVESNVEHFLGWFSGFWSNRGESFSGLWGNWGGSFAGILKVEMQVDQFLGCEVIDEGYLLVVLKVEALMM